jgi:hypothetical protein
MKGPHNPIELEDLKNETIDDIWQLRKKYNVYSEFIAHWHHCTPKDSELELGQILNATKTILISALAKKIATQ